MNPSNNFPDLSSLLDTHPVQPDHQVVEHVQEIFGEVVEMEEN